MARITGTSPAMTNVDSVQVGTGLARSGAELGFCLDRIGDCDRPARHLGVYDLDHAAVDLHDALALVLRQFERSDQLARMRDLVGARREHGVARADLVRMDQRLAV